MTKQERWCRFLPSSRGANSYAPGYTRWFCCESCFTVSEARRGEVIGRGRDYDNTALCEHCRLPLGMVDGSYLIAQERFRQCTLHNMTAEGDDCYHGRELLRGAAAYLQAAAPDDLMFVGGDVWPWDGKYDKREPQPGVDRLAHELRCLAKAGALIAAEIDRLQRVNARAEAAVEKI